ncbi:MAG: hypothetical protein RIB69_03365 [Roseovarius sp.]
MTFQLKPAWKMDFDIWESQRSSGMAARSAGDFGLESCASSASGPPFRSAAMAKISSKLRMGVLPLVDAEFAAGLEQGQLTIPGRTGARGQA